MTVVFKTPTTIPLEAFSLLGINVKTSTNAIGRFGTGLKYAVAVILRHGGKIQLFIDGVEYEFYLSKKDFRGKTFQQVRMRKRDGIGKWLSSKALPFTTEFGKDWSLWQAYRELESNTRDEDGETETLEDGAILPGYGGKGTLICVDCHGFQEAMEESGVFLEVSSATRAHSCSMVDIYDAPSKYLYYQGIRVFNLRYPARLTYDFKAPHVKLTEDRTAENSWMLMYYIAAVLKDGFRDKGVLYKALSKSKNDERYEPTFETQDLNFDCTGSGSDTFMSVSRGLYKSGLGGRSVSNYQAAYSGYVSRSAEKSVSLPRQDWDLIAVEIHKILPQVSGGDAISAMQSLLAKIGRSHHVLDDAPF